MPPPIPTFKIHPHGMSGKNIPGIDILQIMWSPQHILPLNSKQQVQNPTHPMHEIVKRKWESCTDPLRWNCLSSKKVSMRRVVRSWLNSRARVAFVNALKRKGYDTKGYRIAGNGDEVPKPNLVGTLHLATRVELIRAKWPEVEDQADKLVAEVERLQTASSKPKKKKKTDRIIPGQTTNSVGLQSRRSY